MEVMVPFVIGAVIGVFVGSVNNFFFAWAADKAIASGNAGKGRKILFFSMFVRMLGIVAAVYLTVVISGRNLNVIYSMLGGLGLLTLFSPYKRYRSAGSKGAK